MTVSETPQLCFGRHGALVCRIKSVARDGIMCPALMQEGSGTPKTSKQRCHTLLAA